MVAMGFPWVEVSVWTLVLAELLPRLMSVIPILGIRSLGCLNNGYVLRKCYWAGIMTDYQFYLFVVLALLIIFGMGLTQAIFNNLSQAHQDIFQKIGEPNIFLNNTPANNWKFQKFLFCRSYKKLSGKLLSGLCYLLLVVQSLFVVGLLLIPFTIS